LTRLLLGISSGKGPTVSQTNIRQLREELRFSRTGIQSLAYQDILLYIEKIMSSTLESDRDLGTATARFFRILSDPTRLKILDLLLSEPRTVSQLVEALGCPQSRVSNHLACLRWCEFVDAEREGRQITYHIRDQRVRALIDAARELATEHCDHLASCQRIGPDWI
jgi:DNA-binding transcriptional ArsR family regulator